MTLPTPDSIAQKARKPENPYPVSIFPELTEDHTRGLHSEAVRLGISHDRIAAHFMRQAWDACAKDYDDAFAESFLHLSEENTRLEEKLAKLIELAEDSVFKSNGAIGYPPMDEYEVAAHEANEKLINYISLLRL